MPNFDFGTFVHGILVEELNIIVYCTRKTVLLKITCDEHVF